MNIVKAIQEFEETGEISPVFIKWLKEENGEHQKAYQYFKNNLNSAFSKCLLTTLTDLRKNVDNNIFIEDLMFASCLVAVHKQVEDCILIWKAKNVDFDTYCAMDGELIAFEGKEKTIEFLKACSLQEAKEMIGYLDHYSIYELDEYFSSIETKWWF